MPLQLESKLALITGATRGIGRGIARKFAAEGARLILNGRDEQAGRLLVEELSATGSTVDFVGGSVLDPQTLSRIAERVAESGNVLDVMVLNAGSLTTGSIWETSEEAFDTMMAVNVRAPWMFAKRLYTLMPEGASIVMTASVSSFRPYPTEGAYCVSKAATLQLVKVLASEFAPRKIRVNALCPGFVGGEGMSQDLIDASADPSSAHDAFVAGTLLGRAGSVEEMADGALYLASSQSSYVTGTSLVLDGGLLIN